VKKASPATALSTIRIKTLSLPIEITTNLKYFLREFCNLTSNWLFPANGETPAVRFGVIQKRKYKYLEKDGRTLYRIDRDYNLCPMLMDQIRMSCYENVRDYLLFHSGAVVKNGRAILLPAPKQSGKTTLTLGLMNYGYRHLTDEVSAIQHETLEVVPYQRPIYMWNWSRPLGKEVSKSFRSYRYRADEVARGAVGRWQYIVPQDGAVMPRDSRWKVDWIIFPRYTLKGKTVLKPLSTAQAVVSLMQNGWNQELFPDGGLRVCAKLARRARCYTLEMGDLDRACELIEDLQGQGS
jgi:hypothetical protein